MMFHFNEFIEEAEGKGEEEIPSENRDKIMSAR